MQPFTPRHTAPRPQPRGVLDSPPFNDHCNIISPILLLFLLLFIVTVIVITVIVILFLYFLRADSTQSS
jgi:hypothetical protein